MYKSYLLSIVILFTSILQAETVIEGKITEVTVYRTSARETRVASANLPAGTQEVIITNVPPSLDVNSLQVGVKGSVSLLSASTRNNFLTPKSKTEQVKKWEDSLELLSNDIKWIQEQKLVYQNEESTLFVNSKQANITDWLKPEDLLKLTDLVRTRGMEIRKKLFDLNKQEKELTENKNRIQGQLNEWNSQNKTAINEIVLKVDVKAAGSISFRCTYKVPDAGWSPVYDIRAVQGNKPVKVEYKAKVYQNTGYDWNDVLLTVSSGNPNRDQNRPILNPLFVSYEPPVVYRDEVVGYGAPMEKSNMALDLQREGKGEELEEYVTGKEASDYNVTVSDNALNIEFAIDTKQDIPSDRKEHLVNLQSLELPATYTYHAVPSLQSSVYLLARLTNYGQYNLLPAMANIFYDDMYVGQTKINPATTADTMLISLGIDDKISIKRTQLVDYTSKRILSNHKKDTYGYEILVRNNKNYAVDIEILDQLPISKNKEIQVELVEGSGAEHIVDYGRLLWKLKLGPSETKKIRLVYSITYPKDKVIYEFN